MEAVTKKPDSKDKYYCKRCNRELETTAIKLCNECVGKHRQMISDIETNQTKQSAAISNARERVKQYGLGKE